MKRLKREVQCSKCPRKKSTNPHDIPHGYSAEKHRQLQRTIAEPDVDLRLVKGRLGEIRVMACHESPVGDEAHCVGWLMNQLGEGNNIPLRLVMMRYDLSQVKLVGEQHDCFEDTLP